MRRQFYDPYKYLSDETLRLVVADLLHAIAKIDASVSTGALESIDVRDQRHWLWLMHASATSELLTRAAVDGAFGARSLSAY